MLLLYYCFFCTITLLVYGLILMRSGRSRKMKHRIAAYVDGTQSVVDLETDDDSSAAPPSFFKRMLGAALHQVKGRFKRKLQYKMPGAKAERLEMILLRAGRPLNMSVVDLRLLQMALMIVLPIIAWLYGKMLRADVGACLLLALIGLLTAVFLPKLYFRMKTKQRYASALKELPDVLDLLTVSLEAGLGFDAALSKLVSKKDGILASEFQRCLEEIRLGRTRREALVGVRDRLDMDEIKALISSILQAEKLGIGMVQVLRVQSQEAREQRKQRAEEAAMKAPIKMLFPLVLFIFPCLFIILIGPVIIQFVDSFGQ